MSNLSLAALTPQISQTIPVGRNSRQSLVLGGGAVAGVTGGGAPASIDPAGAALVGADYLGPAYEVLAGQDNNPNYSIEPIFWVEFFAEETGGGAAEMGMFVVGSSDGAYWFPVAELMNGTISGATAFQSAPLLHCPRYLGVATTGQATGTNQNGVVRLLSNLGFRLRATGTFVNNAYCTPTVGPGVITPLNGQSGTIVIADAATQGTVTFGTPFSDALYRVALGLDDTPSGVGLTTIGYDNKATTGFDVQIGAAPGIGNTYNVNWIAVGQ